MDTNKHLENVSKIMGKNPPNKEQTIQAQKNQRNNFDDLNFDDELIFSESQIVRDFEPINSVEEVSFNNEGSNIFENVNRTLKDNKKGSKNIFINL